MVFLRTRRSTAAIPIQSFDRWPMTDEEKLEMRNVDEHARRLLERTESLSEDVLLRMHGAMRPAPNIACAAKGSESWTSTTENACTAAQTKVQIEFDDFLGAATPLQGVSVGGIYLRAGARVRLRPKARADLLDLALSGQTAIVESVQQDAERRRVGRLRLYRSLL